MGREQCEKMFGTEMSSLVSTPQEMTDVLPIWRAGTIQLVPLRTLICMWRHTNLEPLMRLFVAMSLEVPRCAEVAPLSMASLQDLKDQHQAHRAALKALRRENL